MNAHLKQLYQSVILQHHKSPLNYDKKEELDYKLLAYNSLCGDKYQLFFEIKDGQIGQIYFYGHGCAISKAATSILTKYLSFQSIEEAKKICSLYQSHLKEDVEVEEDIADFEAFSAAKMFPERLKCASLSWDEIQQFLESLK